MDVGFSESMDPLALIYYLVPLCRLTGPKPSSSLLTIQSSNQTVSPDLFWISASLEFLNEFSQDFTPDGIADSLGSILHLANYLLAQGRPLGICTHCRGFHQTVGTSHGLLEETVEHQSSFHPALEKI